jgi:hypothetical protein
VPENAHFMGVFAVFLPAGKCGLGARALFPWPMRSDVGKGLKQQNMLELMLDGKPDAAR